jgi:TolB-like protein/Flp pilus assembly protein TadD
MSAATPGAVFLSYASQDADAARRIADALRAADVEVWFDQSELRGGDAWDQKIRRQIKECALFVPIISASTQARHEGYFRLEWHLAEQRSHLIARGRPFIVPVTVDQTNDANALVPDAFLAVQWMRLAGGEASAAFCERVKKLLAGDSAEAGLSRPATPGSDFAHAAAAPKGATPPRKSSLPVLLLGGLAILVAGGVTYCVFRPRRSPEEIAKLLAQVQTLAESETAKSLAATKPPATPPAPDSAAKTPVQAGGALADQKSVAVLAFANLSDDKGSEYFSDGISEELLTVLQKMPGLHVAARTSSFYFNGKEATAQEIGAKLGVANLVEGSVQKSGSRVKVTVHLSRAATGEELWSQSYTRELKDVFALQEELALAIVGELRGQLGGAENAAAIKVAVQGGTTNPEAYQQYLQGRYFVDRHSEDALRNALAFYQRAVEIDPSFALAWAGLARTHVWYCEFSTELGQAGFDAHLAKAREATDRALTLAPNLPEALLARSEIQLSFDYDWKGAGETLRTALALAPADPLLVTAAGNLAGVRGDVAGSIALYRQAVALDPVNPAARSYLAYQLAQTGHLAEAEAEYPRVVELNPAAPWAQAGLGLTYLLEGKYEQAVTAANGDAAEYARALIVAMARWSQKRIPEADAALAQLTRDFAGTAAYQVAEVYAYRGEKDRAFEWLERARRQHDGGITGIRTDPLLTNLKDDPRWPVFLRKLGLMDDQLN